MNLQDRKIKIIRKDQRDRLNFHDGDLPFFSIPTLDNLGIRNGFTTKFGGVSIGDASELSMSCRKQSPEIAAENYKRVLKALKMNEKRPVLSYQTHTANIRVVREEDAGKGPFKPRDYVDVDGLITNIPDTPLVTVHADCVPLYFYDPVNKAIGLSHAGWRGTAGLIALNTVKMMQEVFKTDPCNIIAAIGPSICPECYEVGAEAAEVFKTEFHEICEISEILKPHKENIPGKYMLDLQKANKFVMTYAGIKEENIFMTDICTKCNSELLFSHRAHGDRRGLMAAVISL